MYLQIGTPLRLQEIDTTPSLERLKRDVSIAIVDDQVFRYMGELRAHDYQATELGADISSVKQMEAYSIVACDIRGVAPKFGSKQEGAHLISEIRKAYPDKYLIAYTGSTFDPSVNNKLASADSAINKDASFDFWHTELERALTAVGNPRERWLRFRRSLMLDGLDGWKISNIEQAFIKSIKSGRDDNFNPEKLSAGLTDPHIQLIATLAKNVLPSLIKLAV
ncbi:hypothetical protein [Algiphilus sp.]|uniref:hypothetical protein n=1 Tax=Algiphilus sp. TaxID=1872431 RepID=UPI003BAD6F66